MFFAVFCLRGGIIVDIIEIIVETLVGILCFFCAFQIGINKKLELLHAYHYKNIKSENINIFCKKYQWFGCCRSRYDFNAGCKFYF